MHSLNNKTSYLCMVCMCVLAFVNLHVCAYLLACLLAFSLAYLHMSYVLVCYARMSILMPVCLYACLSSVGKRAGKACLHMLVCMHVHIFEYTIPDAGKGFCIHRCLKPILIGREKGYRKRGSNHEITTYY